MSSGDYQGKASVVHCVECGRSNDLYWIGWRALRTDDPRLGEPPALAFYCPACALEQFGPPGERPASPPPG